MNGWRTLVIRSPVALSLRDDTLLMTGEGRECAVPLMQLQAILICTARADLSSGLIARLAQEHIRLTFCDEKFRPCCQSMPLNLNAEAPGFLMDQIEWPEKRRATVWERIVRDKINSQIALLEFFGLQVSPLLRQYAAQIQPGDPTNREGQAARLYFNALFGTEYARRQESDITAAQNYGYTILYTAISQMLAMHGYNTALGIHHANRGNPWNLSCDLVEPFRVFADKLIYENRTRQLDWSYRRELISLPYAECTYDGKETTLQAAMESYALDVLSAMKDERVQIGEIGFARQARGPDADV